MVTNDLKNRKRKNSRQTSDPPSQGHRLGLQQCQEQPDRRGLYPPAGTSWKPSRQPLSRVIWLIYIARTLPTADERVCKELPATPVSTPGTRNGNSGQTPSTQTMEITVDLFSYADDVNPLIITDNTSAKCHKMITQKVGRFLNEVGAEHQINGTPAKIAVLLFPTPEQYSPHAPWA